MASEQLLDLPSAVALLIGANIGTCATVLLASIGSTLSSKRAALSHVLFNLIGAGLFFVAFVPFVSIVALTASDLPRQIANAHLVFNISVSLIMLPFVGALVFAVKKALPGKEVRIDGGVKYLDKRTLHAPALALGQAEKEVERMATIALSALDDSIKAFNSRDLVLVKVVEKKEDSVDELDNAIEAFLVKITRRELSKRQSKRVAALVHSISDIERVSDHANNIGELTERAVREKMVFSKTALKELDLMFRKSRASFSKSVNVLVSGDKEKAQKVLDLEKEIDGLTSQFEQNNYERMNQKRCDTKSSVVFTELLRNLERISDHSRNIAMSIIHGF
jgi:phosphate:Na+ symporter